MKEVFISNISAKTHIANTHRLSREKKERKIVTVGDTCRNDGYNRI